MKASQGWTFLLSSQVSRISGNVQTTPHTKRNLLTTNLIINLLSAYHTCTVMLPPPVYEGNYKKGKLRGLFWLAGNEQRICGLL